MIVCGYDGTPGSHAGLTEALKLAKDIGSDLTVVFAYARSGLPTEMKDLDDAVKARAEVVLKEAQSEAAAVGVTAYAEFRRGEPAETLIEAADASDARYIVVGSYGERPLKSALVGSTPSRLLHLSDRPVVVVRVE